MKRFLMIAVAGAALTFALPASESKAADFYFGGGHGYGHVGGHHGSHHGGGYYGGSRSYYGHNSFRQRVAPSYNSYRYGGYGHHGSSYRSYRPSHYGHGGLHLDVGPLHLGLGRHH